MRKARGNDDSRQRVATVKECDTAGQPNNRRKYHKSTSPSIRDRDTSDAVASEDTSYVADSVDNTRGCPTAQLSPEIERNGSRQIGIGSNHQESHKCDEDDRDGPGSPEAAKSKEEQHHARSQQSAGDDGCTPGLLHSVAKKSSEQDRKATEQGKKSTFPCRLCRAEAEDLDEIGRRPEIKGFPHKREGERKTAHHPETGVREKRTQSPPQVLARARFVLGDDDGQGIGGRFGFPDFEGCFLEHSNTYEEQQEERSSRDHEETAPTEAPCDKPGEEGA